jgi:hypothetical protein
MLNESVRVGPRDQARRGLLLLVCGVGLVLAVALVGRMAFEWMRKQVMEGRDVEWMVDRARLLGTVSAAGAVVNAILIVFGCLLLARASAVRKWAYVALAAALGGVGANAALFAIQRAFTADVDRDMLLALVACEGAASAIQWAALGLAVREVMDHAGCRVPVWAMVIWLVTTAVDLFNSAVSVSALSGVSAVVEWRAALYWIGLGAMLSGFLLLLAARRTVGRSSLRVGADGEDAAIASDQPATAPWQAPAADGLGLYRGALITRVVIAIVAVVVALTLAGGRGGPSGFALMLPVIDIIAAALMVIGLLRFGANLPEGGGGASAGALCMIGAGSIQIYTTFIAWRVADYAERASRATSMWDMPNIGDLIDQAEMLPALELAATTLSLAGFLLLLTSLRWVADWFQRPELRARAAGLSVGACVLVLVAAGLRFYLAKARHPTLELVIPVALAALVGALIFLVLYLIFIRELIHRLRSGRPAVPAARVVFDGSPPP